MYGSVKWVLLATIERKVEGIHNGFLCRVTVKISRQLIDGTWEMPGMEGVREAVVMQSVRTYIGRRQATVDQWVALRPLFEVCAR